MNREWAEINKTMQSQIRRESTFFEGIETLLTLRQKLLNELFCFRAELSREEFDAIPFLNADGYHSKNIAYSIWHIVRIEDIVAHSLILHDEQIFMTGEYQRRIGASIVTTGNELVKQQIAEFTRVLDLDALYAYLCAVTDSTNTLLKNLSFAELKRKMNDEDRERLKSLGVISQDENACWLIDYWCGKDVRGLIQMPFSRHWIMHIEASLRIKNRIHLNRRSEV